VHTRICSVMQIYYYVNLLNQTQNYYQPHESEYNEKLRT
jgi:hypothetical protein